MELVGERIRNCSKLRGDTSTRCMLLWSEMPANHGHIGKSTKTVIGRSQIVSGKQQIGKQLLYVECNLRIKNDLASKKSWETLSLKQYRALLVMQKGETV